jgi:elongation factor Tu
LRWKLESCLSKYDFPGDDVPIISGSALKAIEGDTSEIGVPSIEKLVEEMDKFIPVPERPVDQSFPNAN